MKQISIIKADEPILAVSARQLKVGDSVGVNKEGKLIKAKNRAVSIGRVVQVVGKHLAKVKPWEYNIVHSAEILRKDDVPPVDVAPLVADGHQ